MTTRLRFLQLIFSVAVLAVPLLPVRAVVACIPLPAKLKDRVTCEATSFLTKVLGGAPNQDATPVTIAGDVIKTILGFLGVVFVILIIWAGWNWMTARGNEEQVSKAELQIVHAVIGLLIILSAYIASYIIFDILLEATTGAPIGG